MAQEHWISPRVKSVVFWTHLPFAAFGVGACVASVLGVDGALPLSLAFGTVWGASALGSYFAHNSVVGRIRRIAQYAAALSDGDLSQSIPTRAPGALGELEAALERLARNVENRQRDLAVEAVRQRFSTDLAQALEMVDTEEQVYDVVERALVAVAPDSPTELLLADSSHAHLSRATGTATIRASGGCGVASPQGCAAVRRGQMLSFSDGESLGACPKLQGRGVSAVCVPVAVLGRAVGVLHATGPVGAHVSERAMDEFGVLSQQVGGRLGMIRAMAASQLQASTDPLTGLFNRRAFEDRFAQLQRAGTSVTVALADLDHFKRLNDTYGHEAGDRALRRFAEVLRTTVRSADIVARFGGEEFVIGLPGASPEQAAEVLDRVRSALAASNLQGSNPSCTVSFGVGRCEPGTDLEERVRRADAALYQAKAAGRDRVFVASTTLDLIVTSEPAESRVIVPSRAAP